MLRWMSEHWRKLMGRGVTDDFTAPLEQQMESKRRETLQVEHDALSRAAESTEDPHLQDLAAERRSRLQEAEDFHRSIGG